jgi:hypothetical protein
MSHSNASPVRSFTVALLVEGFGIENLAHYMAPIGKGGVRRLLNSLYFAGNLTAKAADFHSMIVG